MSRVVPGELHVSSGVHAAFTQTKQFVQRALSPQRAREPIVALFNAVLCPRIRVSVSSRHARRPCDARALRNYSTKILARVRREEGSTRR